MSDIVTGTPAVVGFTNGYGSYRDHNHGWNGKDMQFATTVDRGEQTRDIMSHIFATNVAIEKVGAANSLATEKVGAANSLATEKVGAANNLAIEKVGAAAVITAEKIGAAAVQATHDQSHLLALQLCDVKAALQLELEKCCCEIRKEVAEVKATVLSTDASRIRDELQKAQNELLIMHHQSRGNGGNGNGNS